MGLAATRATLAGISQCAAASVFGGALVIRTHERLPQAAAEFEPLDRLPGDLSPAVGIAWGMLALTRPIHRDQIEGPRIVTQRDCRLYICVAESADYRGP